MIPRAFRIRDFRSIVDTGECPLSVDGITVLAGQNEAGKSSVLMALRDFDLGTGVKPYTPDFVPDANFDAVPRVSVLFEVDIEELEEHVKSIGGYLPSAVLQEIKTKGVIWITRYLHEAVYKLDESLIRLWPVINAEEIQPPDLNIEDDEVSDAIENGEEDNELEENDDEDVELPLEILSPIKLAENIRPLWPLFVYFDSFEDILPREVELDIGPKVELPKTTDTTKPSPKPSKKLPNTVQDFITLSGIDLDRVALIANQDKALTNYLADCSASITGDFLTYWTQTANGKDTVNLLVKHMRSDTGGFKLQFYVHDQTDQYPEQRSRGFLWFLSFYLRLAAWDKSNDHGGDRLLLIDEPGSYLHAKAQRDILKVLEQRVKDKNQTFIYTTHSPYLLPASDTHRFRVTIKHGSEGTKILDRLTHPLLSEDKFSDALSPFITNIGFDISDVIPMVGENNLLVEGISDYMYIHSWTNSLKNELSEKINVFPGKGASSLETLVSLFIGWGLPFAVLLDHDDMGNSVADTLRNKFLLSEEQLIQPSSSVAIEDLFSYTDFKSLLTELDKRYTLIEKERPSDAIKRQKIDKVLLARKYVELVNQNMIALSQKSQQAIVKLLEAIEQGIVIRPKYYK